MLGNLHDNDIKLLRMFHTIAQCGGFAAAQAQLNLSQSAISTQMAQLETRLGCRLCERGRGVFKLTNQGKAVIKASEKLFGALEDFRTEVAESQGRLFGELRLGLIDNTVTHDNPLIRNALRDFAVAAPEAKITIYIGGAVELEQQVVDDRLHLAIGLFHHQLESLEYTTLFAEDHVLYCSDSHPLFARRDEEITETDLLAARYVSWGYGEGLPGWKPPFRFKEVASSAYVEGAAYLILSGRYIGYLPVHYARHWLAENSMRALLPEATQRSVNFSLIKRKSGRVSRLMASFLSCITPPDDERKSQAS